jgi:Ca2+-transporting ATPase
MVLAIGITFILQLALIYVPFLQQFFGTKPLAPRDLMIALVFSLIVFAAVEIEKLIRRLMNKNQ